MVLLEVLRRISKKNGWRLTVAHFNHLLRGEEADEDARFVAKRAGNLGLNFRKGREDIRKAAAEKGVSIEMAAREARHRFFVQAAAKENASKIALAHHA